MMLFFQMSFVENVWSGANQVTSPFQVPSIAGYERIMLKSGYWSRIFFFFIHITLDIFLLLSEQTKTLSTSILMSKGPTHV